MKIAVLMPTLNAGGAERVISVLAEEWAKQGVSVSILLFAKAEVFYSLPEAVSVIDVSHPYHNTITKILAAFVTAFRIRSEIQDIKPDCIVSFMEGYNEYNLFTTLGLGVPMIVSDRNNPHLTMGYIRRKIKSWLYRRAAGIVAQTASAEDCLSQLTGGEVPIQVISNPLRDLRPAVDVQRKKLILSVGRLEPQKGQADLIRAFFQLECKDWKLRILGEGRLRPVLESLAHSLGVSDRIEMPGACADVDQHLAEASIFAFPSHFEGFPNALCEAMASGLCCVAADCPTGPKEIIQDGVNGRLYPVGDVKQLMTILSEFTTDSERCIRYAEDAKRIAEQLNKAKIADVWLKFIRKLTTTGQMECLS